MSITREHVIDRLLALPREIEIAETDLINSERKLNALREDLRAKEVSLLANGSIDGKNAEIRNAQLRQATQAERDAAGTYEVVIPQHKSRLNLRLNEFSAYRAIARLIGGVEGA